MKINDIFATFTLKGPCSRRVLLDLYSVNVHMYIFNCFWNTLKKYTEKKTSFKKKQFVSKERLQIHFPKLEICFLDKFPNMDLFDISNS